MPYTHHHTSHPRPRVHHTPRTYTMHSSLSSFTTSCIHVLEYVFPRTTRRNTPHPSTSPLGPGRGLTSLSDPHHARVDVSFHRGDARATRDDDDAFVDHLARVVSSRKAPVTVNVNAKRRKTWCGISKTRLRGRRGELDDVGWTADNEINNDDDVRITHGDDDGIGDGGGFSRQIRLMISVLGLGRMRVEEAGMDCVISCVCVCVCVMNE